MDTRTAEPSPAVGVPRDPPADVPADFATPPGGGPARDGGEPDEHLQDSDEAKGFYDRAVREAESGDEEQAVVHFLRASKTAENAREWYLAALALHAVADIFASPAPPYDLEKALRMYRRAAAAYGQCGHFDEARELVYRANFLQLRHARELGLSRLMRVELFLFWAVSGFGFRPHRVLATGLAVVLAFAVGYWAADGVATPAGEPVGGFGTAAYFSGVTFLTIGYGDLVPAPHVRWAAVAEGAIGVATISFFVVVLSNRLRH